MYKTVSPTEKLAVPVRGALVDLTQVEFRHAQAAHSFAANHPRRPASTPTTTITDGLARFERVIAADAERVDRIAQRFGEDACAASALIADLAAAYAAAGLGTHTPVGADHGASLTLLAAQPQQLLWIAAEAQRVVAAAAPPARPRPPAGRIVYGRPAR